MMELVTDLTWLKTLGIIVTGILGIFGVLGKFKRRDGKLSRWGIVTIIGILLSMSISWIVTSKEAEKEKEEAHKQLDRMEVLYEQISRAIQPITHVGLAYSIALPMHDKSIADYATYLDGIISSRKSSLQHSAPHYPLRLPVRQQRSCLMLQ